MLQLILRTNKVGDVLYGNILRKKHHKPYYDQIPLILHSKRFFRIQAIIDDDNDNINDNLFVGCCCLKLRLVMINNMNFVTYHCSKWELYYRGQHTKQNNGDFVTLLVLIPKTDDDNNTTTVCSSYWTLLGECDPSIMSIDIEYLISKHFGSSNNTKLELDSNNSIKRHWHIDIYMDWLRDDTYNIMPYSLIGNRCIHIPTYYRENVSKLDNSSSSKPEASDTKIQNESLVKGHCESKSIVAKKCNPKQWGYGHSIKNKTRHDQTTLWNFISGSNPNILTNKKEYCSEHISPSNVDQSVESEGRTNNKTIRVINKKHAASPNANQLHGNIENKTSANKVKQTASSHADQLYGTIKNKTSVHPAKRTALSNAKQLHGSIEIKTSANKTKQTALSNTSQLRGCTKKLKSANKTKQAAASNTSQLHVSTNKINMRSTDKTKQAAASKNSPLLSKSTNKRFQLKKPMSSNVDQWKHNHTQSKTRIEKDPSSVEFTSSSNYHSFDNRNAKTDPQASNNGMGESRRVLKSITNNNDGMKKD